MKKERKEKIIRKISELLPEGKWKIFDAMKYTPLSGGKLLRSQMVLAVGDDFGFDENRLLGICAAVEIFHSGTLIHDDMPEIDDANYRRGKKALHKVYGSGMALLAGDGLFFTAFKVISSYPQLFSPFSEAAYDVLIGEAMDVEMEERANVGQEEIEEMYRKKTGALFGFSFSAPAYLLSDERSSFLRKLGEDFGVAFQIYDDIKDVKSTVEKIGKDTGKDVNKKTFVKLFGVEEAEKIADGIIKNVKRNLKESGFVNLFNLIEEIENILREG